MDEIIKGWLNKNQHLWKDTGVLESIEPVIPCEQTSIQ